MKNENAAHSNFTYMNYEIVFIYVCIYGGCEGLITKLVRL